MWEDSKNWRYMTKHDKQIDLKMIEKWIDEYTLNKPVFSKSSW